MCIRIRFDQGLAETGGDARMRTPVHATGGAADLGHDPSARRRDDRRRMAQRGPTTFRLRDSGSPAA